MTEAITQTLPGWRGDLLWLFWAGHGVLTRDERLRLFYSDASIAYKRNLELASLLTALRSDLYPGLPRQIGVVDACQTYAERLQLAATLPAETLAYGQPLPGREQFVLYAASPGQVAVNLGTAKAGLFSQMVMEELTGPGGDGWPPAMERVAERLDQRFKKLGADQKPTKFYRRSWKGGEHVSEKAPIEPQLERAVAIRHPIGRLVGELSARPFAMGVHRAISAGRGDLSELPDYVRRAHDDRLLEVIAAADRASVMIVLVGDSSSGKTRALWEAIGHLPGDWRVWSPADARALNYGLANVSIGPRMVVWLNDAHNYLDPGLTQMAGDNAARLRELVNDPSAEPVLVAATLWPWNWQQLAAQPREHPLSAGSGSQEDELAQVATLLENSTYIPVPDSFQGDDLAAMRAAAARDPRIALAVRHAPAGKITQYLAGAQKLLERYNAAPSETKAVIDAAIDARRLGHANRLPERLLLEAAPGYIDDETWDRLDDSWAVQALHAATLDWRGLDGPLTRIKPRPGEPVPDEPEYRLGDVVEQAGTRVRQYAAPPDELWAAATRYGHADDLDAMAHAAQIRGRYRHAAALYLKAADAGNTWAMMELAKMLKKTGDAAGAIHLYRQAADAGHTWAVLELAQLQTEARHATGAESLYRQAADAGDRRAMWELAQIRERAGDHAEAEQLAVMAADAGEIGTLRQLAEMRGPSVHIDAYTTSEEYVEMQTRALDEIAAEAMRLYEQAAEAGHSWAVRELAQMQKEAGDDSGDHLGGTRLPAQAAETAYMRILWRSARDREQAGDWAGAEERYQQAADIGDTSVIADLARMRERAGDHVQAEQLAVTAAKAGNGGPLVELMRMRERAGDQVGAEHLATVAAGTGSTGALQDLARIRDRAGDHLGAARLYERAADAGHTSSLKDRARMLEEAGDQAGAERWRVRAVNFGVTGALEDLAQTRERAGDHAGAEHLRRFGLDASGISAGPWNIAQVARGTGV